MTAQEKIYWLKKEGLLDLLISEAMLQGKGRDVVFAHINSPYTSAADVINYSMGWANSSQGRDFWNDAFIKASEIERLL